MNRKIFALAAIPLLTGCGLAYGAGAGVHVEEGYYEGPYYEAAYGGVEVDRGYARHVNDRRLPVPRRLLPAPGRCRVWLPGVAPGYQPRSGSCRALEHRVPPGAWLLVRPYRAPEVVELIATGTRGRGVRIRYVYDVRSGRRVNGY